MKIEEIEKLLDEFYEGNATEKQEEALRYYFETQEVPEHLRNEKELFLSFRQDDCVEVPAGLEDKLNRMINEKEEEARRFFRRNKSQRNWRWVGGIAASLLLLFGIGYGISNYQSNHMEQPQDTFSNPQDAYKVLQATLIEVSADLNSGINQVKDSRREIKKIHKEIKKEIQ